MKILLTGMASAHTSKKVHDVTFGFFGVLNDMLSLEGHDITWTSSSLEWDKKYLDEYDAIFVGVVPPTSVSANHAYGALNVVDTMFDSPKLHLVVDTPQYWAIEPSLQSVLRNTENLVKPFYSKRKDYLLATKKKHLSKLVSACSKLSTDSWPVTIYPSLPWLSDEDIAEDMPSGARSSLIGLNFDSHYSSPANNKVQRTADTWLVNTLKTKWTKQVSANLSGSVQEFKARKNESDQYLEDKMAASAGVLVSPQDRTGKTWWSLAFIRALANGAVVATEWREAFKISPSWAHLPSQIEDMTDDETHSLLLKQRSSYLNAIPDMQESLDNLNNLLINLEKKEQNA